MRSLARLSSSLSANLPASLPTGTNPGTSGIQAPQKKGKKKGAYVDDAMATINKKIEGSERLERRVDELIQVESNPRTVWAHGMGTEMNTMTTSGVLFLKDTFQLLVKYKEKSKVLKQQQAPGPSTQASVPTYQHRQQQ